MRRIPPGPRRGCPVSNLADVITHQHIVDFATDGVVCLRQVINPDWIEKLTAGLERNVVDPSPRGRVWNRDEHGRVTFYDSQVWQEIPEYRDFVENSPMAELAGRVMNVEAVNFFFDAIFTRSTGSQFRTPFHQDEPYWSVDPELGHGARRRGDLQRPDHPWRIGPVASGSRPQGVQHPMARRRCPGHVPAGGHGPRPFPGDDRARSRPGRSGRGSPVSRTLASGTGCRLTVAGRFSPPRCG
ncbi:MAG: hypothetical protein EBY61_03885 [Actinobacteria bacterium]|nr:hypothetical protein [Actinomycetota bacterium]